MPSGNLATRRRHTFDFIEGEMLEKSPFWFYEFFKQRERWMKGITMVVLSERISWRSKVGLAQLTQSVESIKLKSRVYS